MKLLSLWEPWATLMAIGAKRIETRSWETAYRGWLAIHASKCGLTKDALSYYLNGPFRLALAGERLSPGCIVAVVYLQACCPTEDVEHNMVVWNYWNYPVMTEQEKFFGNYEPGRWAWVTNRLFRLREPIPFKGKQGLVEVPEATLAELRTQLKAGEIWR